MWSLHKQLINCEKTNVMSERFSPDPTISIVWQHLDCAQDFRHWEVHQYLQPVGYILRLPEEIRQASLAMNWNSVSGKQKPGRLQKIWRTSGKIYKQWKSRGEQQRIASDHSQWKKLVAQCRRGTTSKFEVNTRLLVTLSKLQCRIAYE